MYNKFEDEINPQEQVSIDMGDSKGTNINVKWNQYENSKYELPFTHSVPESYYKLRWKILDPLSVKVISGICLGEALAILSLSIFFILYYGTNFNLKMSGKASDFLMAIGFLFAAKNSILTFLFGISYERQLFWHKFCIYCSLFVGFLHFLLSSGPQKKEWQKIPGIALFVCVLLIILFSQNWVRRSCYGIFKRAHFVFIILIVIFSFIHKAKLTVHGFQYYLVDQTIRMIVIYFNRKNTYNVKSEIIPGDIIKLTFKKNTFQYKGGQYLFLCVPKISYLEWHPFSISSSPHQDDITIHIRVLGDWTQQLYDLVKEQNEIKCFIAGPYGNPGIDIDSEKYQCFLFITGGIGITPMMSIASDLYQQSERGRKLKKIFFVWSVREKQMLKSIKNIDIEQSTQDSLNSSRLPIQFQPDLLQDIQQKSQSSFACLDEEVLEEYFYLTSVKKNASEEERKQAGISDVEQLQENNVNFGRPNLPKIFRQAKEYARKNSLNKIGVLCCGPEKMVKEVQFLSQSFSNQGDIRFDFHSELFDF